MLSVVERNGRDRALIRGDEMEQNRIIKSVKGKNLMLPLRDGFSLEINKLSHRRTSEMN